MSAYEKDPNGGRGNGRASCNTGAVCGRRRCRGRLFISWAYRWREGVGGLQASEEVQLGPDVPVRGDFKLLIGEVALLAGVLGVWSQMGKVSEPLDGGWHVQLILIQLEHRGKLAGKVLIKLATCGARALCQCCIRAVMCIMCSESGRHAQKSWHGKQRPGASLETQFLPIHSCPASRKGRNKSAQQDLLPFAQASSSGPWHCQKT